VGNLSWNIATFNSFLILLNLEKRLSPEQLVTIKLRNKVQVVDKTKTTNLRHQAQGHNEEGKGSTKTKRLKNLK